MTRTSTTHLTPLLGGFLFAQRHRGACSEQTAELFFDSGGLAGRAARKAREQAKVIYRLCPVLQACRAYARADPSLEGIWGGETQDERRAARHTLTGSSDMPADNEEGRRLAGLAAQLAHRDGLDAAARALRVPPATLRRAFALYGLDQPPDPASRLSASAKGGEPPWPPSARRPPATAISRRRRGSRSRSSSPSKAGLSVEPPRAARPMTPATRPPDPSPIRHESPPEPPPAKERT
jgi:WhiB family transcriptional regulator, redox-sensing transcriptional regulator